MQMNNPPKKKKPTQTIPTPPHKKPKKTAVPKIKFDFFW